jgi:hypothetical protein
VTLWGRDGVGGTLRPPRGLRGCVLRLAALRSRSLARHLSHVTRSLPGVGLRLKQRPQRPSESARSRRCRHLSAAALRLSSALPLPLSLPLPFSLTGRLPGMGWYDY